MRVAIAVLILILGFSAQAQQSSCTVPLNEVQSAPATDLIQDGASVDRDIMIDQIRNGFDSSSLEPQQSDLYVGTPQPLVQYADMPYPGSKDSVDYISELGSVSGLVRARVVLTSNPTVAYQLNFSLDAHAALARNALLRRLGYAIPSPKHYPEITVNFPSLEDRDAFLDNLAGDTLTARGRWVVGGIDEINKNKLTITFNDAVLEPAVIEVPQMHWGILTSDTIDSRRSIRALLVPLTLLDISESVNMYSFEPAKIFNDGLSFTRSNAAAFKNETSIGDVKWISAKIAKLDRNDWTAILQAGRYPADIQALLVEKTLGRVDQLMKLVHIKKWISYDEYITIGNVINGKAMQELYPDYALRFTYGDPKSPLRASELLRFFGIDLVNGGLSYLIDKANKYLQVITPEKWIKEHNQQMMDDITNHIQNHPDQPYIQPISIFGGPIVGGNVNASRNIVTGTYYGSNSQVQLVDAITAAVNVGGFFGVSGIRSVGISLSPQAQYNRSYVHVRPLTDIKTAWKDNWSNLLVPRFLDKLAGTLAGKSDQDAGDAIKAFLAQMKTGEMFIVTDGLAAGGTAQAQIPLGALLGLAGSFSNISADLTLGTQYAMLSRTTIYKTADGIQIYLNRIHSGNFQTALEADFLVKVISLGNTSSRGDAHTKVYVFPEKFDTDTQAKSFQTGMRNILRRNNPEMLEEEFKPYELNHTNKGSKQALSIGPWTWSKRENFHQVNITPPVDPDGKYEASEFKRTVVAGQITKISGSNFLGFLGGILKKVVPFINIGTSSGGDDPSAGLGGRSKTFAVNTEVEITPSRPNHLFTKLQESHAGWTMPKKGLLKLVERISNELGDLNPNGGLINPSEFSQTKKIQAYTVLWNLLAYEKGINRVIDILNIKTTKTKDAQNFMVDLVGKKEYERYCYDNGLDPTMSVGPYPDENTDGTVIESSNGQTTVIGCVMPFMATAYDLRSRLTRHPEVFMPDVRSLEDAKEKVRWVNRILNKLNNDLSLSQMIKWMGKENAYFQVHISGFRTHDENGDSDYFSNTVGDVDPDVVTGPLSEISDTTQISSNELEARYLSDGY